MLPKARYTGDASPGTMRDVPRMREISCQAMVEGTACARVQRALNIITVPSGQSRDYQVGTLASFHRRTSSQDVAGWRGTAKSD